MAEILDIVDEQGRPTGQTVPRAVAHAEGIRHRTSHVWILRRHAGRVEVLLQMRCQAKDSFPGCYDISSAGHIPAGCDFVESALRELREELGVTLPADALQECGTLPLRTFSTAGCLKITRSARYSACGWTRTPRISPCRKRRSTTCGGSGWKRQSKP